MNHLDVRDRARNYGEVDRPVTENLIGNICVTGSGNTSDLLRPTDINTPTRLVRFVPISEVGLASAARTECPASIDTSGGSVSADATFALDSTIRS